MYNEEEENLENHENLEKHNDKEGEVLSPLKKKQKQTIIHQRFEGPIPPPEILFKYNQITPGLANRIVRMAEQEGDHRRNLEISHLTAQIKHLERADSEATRGQTFAFIIAMTAIIGGVFAIVHGYSYAGSFITTLGIGGIITTFIKGRFGDSTKKNKPSRNEKNKAAPNS